MIEAKNLTKKFGDFTALDNMSCTIPKGCIYGLIGSNGAGKSTFLRTVAGIYCGDHGTVTLDGDAVYNNPIAKSKFVFVPDDLYFLPNSDLFRMAKLYSSIYKTFDGLDVAVRNLVKTVLYQWVEENGLTVVVSSHALRELEDTCDQLALLYKGGIIFERDIQNLKTSLFKVQIAFEKESGKEVFDGLTVLSYKKQGRVLNAIIRGDREAVTTLLSEKKPLLIEILPLSLEEVFIHEMEALGYKYEIDMEEII